MKPFALAACAGIVGCASAGAVAQEDSVTFYGALDLGMTYTSQAGPGNRRRLSMDSGVGLASRIGVRGRENLGGGLAAMFQLENGFGADDGAMSTPGTLFDRKSVVGLAGDWGIFTLGRQTDFLEDIGLKYTSFPLFGGGGVRAAHFNNLDRVIGVRNNNAARLDLTNNAGWVGSVYYGFGEAAGSAMAGQAWGIGGNYTAGAFGMGAAYYQSRLAADNAAPLAKAGDRDLKTYTIGTSYQVSNARWFLAWSHIVRPLQQPLPGTGLARITSASRADVLDIGVDYAVSGKLHLLASVIHDRVVLARVMSGRTSGSTNQVNLGLDYYFSARSDVYLIYGHQAASGVVNPGVIGMAYASGLNNDSGQHVLRAGLKHRF